VQERYTETIRLTIKGKLITRHGVDVLKLESELSAQGPVVSQKQEKKKPVP